MLTSVLFGRRFLAVLTSLVLLAGLFGRVGVAWMCEGRVCSSDGAACCCASPKDAKDGSCRRAAARSGFGVCKAQCGCKSVVTRASSPNSLAQSKVVLASDGEMDGVPPAPLALTVAQDFTSLESPQLRAIPPPDGLPEPPCVEHASPRAPPFATV